MFFDNVFIVLLQLHLSNNLYSIVNSNLAINAKQE